MKELYQLTVTVFFWYFTCKDVHHLYYLYFIR